MECSLKWKAPSTHENDALFTMKTQTSENALQSGNICKRNAIVLISSQLYMREIYDFLRFA